MKAKKSDSDDIREEIALRAYYIWERAGRPEGRQQEHWALAEAEILSEQSATKAAPPKKTVKKAPAEKKAPIAAKAEPVKAPVAAKKSGNGSAAPVVAAAAAKAKKPVKTKTAKPLPHA